MKYVQSFYNILIDENENEVFLYNSYSGALISLEHNIYDNIKNAVIDTETPCKYFEQLLEQGFLIPQELNEFNKIIINERRAIYEANSKKLSFVVAPTLSCNLNCKYCFEEGIRENIYMTEETVSDSINFVLNNITPETEHIHISWFGGEPMLAYQTIVSFSKQLIENLKEKSIRYTCSITTNGLLLSEDKVKYLAENFGLKSTQITVDGTEKIYCERKGATKEQYKKVLSNIKNSIKYIEVYVRLNCSKDNFNDIKQLSNELLEMCDKNSNLHLYLAKLVDYGCRCDEVSYFSQPEFDKKHIEFKKMIASIKGEAFIPYIPQYRRSFCGLFKLKNFVIGPDGSLYKCEHFVGRNDKIIGNVKQSVFYTDELLEFLDNKVFDSCRLCKIFPLCIGGCPAQKQDLKEGNSCYFSLEYIKELLKNYIKISEKGK